MSVYIRYVFVNQGLGFLVWVYMYSYGGRGNHLYITEEIGVACMTSIFHYEIDLKFSMKNIALLTLINI